MSKLWFKSKRYGYGWYPCSWEGWLVIVVGVALMVWVLTSVASLALRMLLYLVIAVLLVFISWLKGEPARWRWG